MQQQAPIIVRGRSVPANDRGEYETSAGDIVLRCFRQETPISAGRPWLAAVRLAATDQDVHAWFEAVTCATPQAAMNAAIDSYERVMRYLGSRSVFQDPCPDPLPFEPGRRVDSDVGPPDALFPTFDNAL